MILTRLRRTYLYSILFFSHINKKEDITIVEGVKNISDRERIINNLDSIRGQDYDRDLIHIILVDYDSDAKLIPRYQEICHKYNAEYVRVDDKPVWNRAHALNIGIKRVKTKYILCSDVDILFEKNYIKEAVGELKKDPLQVILSLALYLPGIPVGVEEYRRLKLLARIKCPDIEISAGINLALTYFYLKIKGHDEQYRLWGFEDTDLVRRFKTLGLKIKSIQDRASYLHQYHAKYRNVKEMPDYEEGIEKNEKYFKNSHSIIRNKNGWGDPRAILGHHTGL